MSIAHIPRTKTNIEREKYSLILKLRNQLKKRNNKSKLCPRILSKISRNILKHFGNEKRGLKFSITLNLIRKQLVF